VPTIKTGGVDNDIQCIGFMSDKMSIMRGCTRLTMHTVGCGDVQGWLIQLRATAEGREDNVKAIKDKTNGEKTCQVSNSDLVSH